jgi:streptogramin lyase
MRRAAAITVLMLFVPVCAVASNDSVPGARVVKVCAAAGARWPTMTLAIEGTAAWIVCKEQWRIIRVNTRTGKRTTSVRLRAPAIAVRSGLGSIWALDSGGTLYRLNAKRGKVAKRISLGVAAAYNIWIGGGSAWVADDQGAAVVRVSPRSNRVVARIAAGDGPSSMAFDGAVAWVINHRDTTLTRIDLTTNRSTRLTTLGGDAPERMIWSNGSLWITGRGTDLLKVRPADGSLQKTIELGDSGIDLVADGSDLWIPTRSVEVDRRGFPTMDALKRVSSSSEVVSTVARPTGRVDVHGLATASGAVWIADNRRGYVYRVARR